MEETEKKLWARIDELEDSARPAEEETKEEKAMSTRAQLVDKVRELEGDCVGTLATDFKTAVEKLKIVNPKVDMVTKGIIPYYLILDGKIQVTPRNDN